MLNKKVLLIGGGIGQFYLAKKLYDKGIDFIVVAHHVLNEFRDWATKIIEHDLFDLEGVLSIAKEEGIEAVLSDQHDLYIPTVAYVAEHMNLPGNTFEQVNSYCNKNIFRSICDHVGVPVPKHLGVTRTKMSIRTEDFSFPVMVKPADSQSSVGVTKVDTEDDLNDALINAVSLSRSGTAIIEEFFSGHEVVCEGLIQDGEYFNLDFADRVYFDLPDKFIPSQTLFPSTIPKEVKEQILDYERRIAHHVNPHFAIVHSEYLWDKQTNQIRCVESALRGGGVFISSHLIPACTGIDINDLLIDFALGTPIDVKSLMERKENKASAYICFYLPQGVVDSITGVEELRKRQDVIMACLDNLRVGKVAEKMEHKGSRLGPILIRANSRQELDNTILAIQNILKVSVNTTEGCKTQIWK